MRYHFLSTGCTQLFGIIPGHWKKTPAASWLRHTFGAAGYLQYGCNGAQLVVLESLCAILGGQEKRKVPTGTWTIWTISNYHAIIYYYIRIVFLLLGLLVIIIIIISYYPYYHTIGIETVTAILLDTAGARRHHLGRRAQGRFFVTGLSFPNLGRSSLMIHIWHNLLGLETGFHMGLHGFIWLHIYIFIIFIWFWWLWCCVREGPLESFGTTPPTHSAGRRSSSLLLTKMMTLHPQATWRKHLEEMGWLWFTDHSNVRDHRRPKLFFTFGQGPRNFNTIPLDGSARSGEAGWNHLVTRHSWLIRIGSWLIYRWFLAS